MADTIHLNGVHQSLPLVQTGASSVQPTASSTLSHVLLQRSAEQPSLSPLPGALSPLPGDSAAVVSAKVQSFTTRVLLEILDSLPLNQNQKDELLRLIAQERRSLKGSESSTQPDKREVTNGRDAPSRLASERDRSSISDDRDPQSRTTAVSASDAGKKLPSTPVPPRIDPHQLSLKGIAPLLAETSTESWISSESVRQLISSLRDAAETIRAAARALGPQQRSTVEQLLQRSLGEQESVPTSVNQSLARELLGLFSPDSENPASVAGQQASRPQSVTQARDTLARTIEWQLNGQDDASLPAVFWKALTVATFGIPSATTNLLAAESQSQPKEVADLRAAREPVREQQQIFSQSTAPAKTVLTSAEQNSQVSHRPSGMHSELAGHPTDIRQPSGSGAVSTVPLASLSAAQMQALAQLASRVVYARRLAGAPLLETPRKLYTPHTRKKAEAGTHEPLLWLLRLSSEDGKEHVPLELEVECSNGARAGAPPLLVRSAEKNSVQNSVKNSMQNSQTHDLKKFLERCGLDSWVGMLLTP